MLIDSITVASDLGLTDAVCLGKALCLCSPYALLLGLPGCASPHPLFATT